jgi:hypothetical protein
VSLPPWPTGIQGRIVKSVTGRTDVRSRRGHDHRPHRDSVQRQHRAGGGRLCTDSNVQTCDPRVSLARPHRNAIRRRRGARCRRQQAFGRSFLTGRINDRPRASTVFAKKCEKASQNSQPSPGASHHLESSKRTCRWMSHSSTPSRLNTSHSYAIHSVSARSPE